MLHEFADYPHLGSSDYGGSGVAGGNFVCIAGKLPVIAMVGFIGNLQLILFLRILYVVAADELMS